MTYFCLARADPCHCS